MPFTVITLTNTPKSLRGDLTKWMQEISTGVYVGNFSSRVREKLWKRVIDNVGQGEATISYNYKNEIGYYFETYNTSRKVIDFDGIHLVILEKENHFKEIEKKLGFSNASKFRKSKKYPKKKSHIPMVFLDIETTGFDDKRDCILEIGAIKIGEKNLEFSELIKSEVRIPEDVARLTGIKEEDILGGRELKNVLEDFLNFATDSLLVGYNISFDLKFINNSLEKSGLNKLQNRSIDLMNFVKKDNQFLSDYKFQTALSEYGIDKKQPHRALGDAKLCYELSLKVNKFQDFIKRK